MILNCKEYLTVKKISGKWYKWHKTFFFYFKAHALQTILTIILFYDCQDFQCDEKYYKCPGYYCIPLRNVCNMIWDCPRGLDEKGCLEKQSCSGLFKCFQSNMTICISTESVCDTVSDCYYGDDELFCNLPHCATQCTCFLYTSWLLIAYCWAALMFISSVRAMYYLNHIKFYTHIIHCHFIVIFVAERSKALSLIVPTCAIFLSWVRPLSGCLQGVAKKSS